MNEDFKVPDSVSGAFPALASCPGDYAPAVSSDSLIALNTESGHFFVVRLEEFDGPLDLLLHLVKQNELPIAQLSLAKIAEQYMSCIQAIEDFDLELAGEYLVIAATLISIKASVVLNEPVEIIEDDSGLLDPHQELLKKLKEMAIYKDGAQKLSGRNLLGVDVFATTGLLEEIQAPTPKLKAHDPLLLGQAFRKMLEQTGNQAAVLSFTMDTMSILERMMRVVDLLKQAPQGKLTLENLIEDKKDKAGIIGSFLALLELSKRQLISVRQEVLFEEVFIELTSESTDQQLDFVEKMQSEFDADLPDDETQKTLKSA